MRLFTRDFWRRKSKDTFRVLRVWGHDNKRSWNVRIELTRTTTWLWCTYEISEIVEYDNAHRRAAENRFWTFCPYLWDRAAKARWDSYGGARDGYEVLINEDSTEHSFIKLTKQDIEREIDRYWALNNIVVQGTWN